MEIKIGIGIKNILFGMTQNEVEAILGEPNKIIKEEYPLDWIIYEYNDEMVRLSFHKDENWRLYEIRVHNQDIELFNENIFNKSKEAIKSMMSQRGFNKLRSIEFSPL